jgi:flagellar assembly protein FliH
LSKAKVVKRYLQYEVPPDVIAAVKNAVGGAPPRGLGEGAEVIRARLEEAAREAEGILREAEEAASAMLREAEARAGDIRREAEEAGREAGFARGLEEGREMAKAAVAEHMAELMALADQMRGEREEAIAREERDLILIALEAAKRVMRQQCRVDGDAISVMIEEILQESEGAVRLYLSEFQDTLQFRLDKHIVKKIHRFAGGLKTILVKDDDCVMLETETGIVDASIPSQLKILEEALLDGE